QTSMKNPAAAGFFMSAGMFLHVALDIGTGRDHRVALLSGILQRLGSEPGGQPLTAQRIWHKGSIDIHGLLAQVHIGKIGSSTLGVDIELLAFGVMLDRSSGGHGSLPDNAT